MGHNDIFGTDVILPYGFHGRRDTDIVVVFLSFICCLVFDIGLTFLLFLLLPLLYM
jgi:hypothetical protein